MRNALIIALFLTAPLMLRAQPDNTTCATAELLCAPSPTEGENTGAGGVPGFCPGTDALIWYTFVTNSVGGTVDVAITSLECGVVPGQDNEMNIIVLSGDGSCTLTGFTAASDCVRDSVDFTLTSFPLAPLTRYWILISGVMNGFATAPAQCAFTPSISGPGADIIDVDVDAGLDVTMGEGESTQLQGIGGPDLEWSPTVGLSGSDIPDPIAQPPSTTVYSLTSEINGCTYIDQVRVEVVRLISPANTFTPNGDGINDTWDIPSLADYPGAEITIHDRWGQVVLKSTGYRTPWDGTHNGRTLAVGTYYYHIKLNQLEGNSPPYTGFVTIVR